MKLTEIDTYLLECNPEKYLPLMISSIEDLFDNYLILSNLKYDFNNRDRLIKILGEYILSPKRNKKSVARNILYKILRNSDGIVHDKSIVNLLFEVYKKLAFQSNQDSWRISIFLKDLELSEDAINWFIENQETNELILNRILRYPVYNKQLQSWAEDCLKNEKVPNGRYSETLALVLNEDNFQTFYENRNIKTENIAWAIFYSKINNKESYLMQLVDRDMNCIHISKVALKLNLCKVIEEQKRRMALIAALTRST